MAKHQQLCVCVCCCCWCLIGLLHIHWVLVVKQITGLATFTTHYKQTYSHTQGQHLAIQESPCKYAYNDKLAPKFRTANSQTLLYWTSHNNTWIGLHHRQSIQVRQILCKSQSEFACNSKLLYYHFPLAQERNLSGVYLNNNTTSSIHVAASGRRIYKHWI